MNTWLYIAILSYCINAVVLVVHKLFLSKSLPSPVAYAFFDGMLSLMVLLFVPFGFLWLAWDVALFSILTGAIFFFGFILLLKALREGEASIIVPVSGAFTPIFIFAISNFLFQESFSNKILLAFVLLVIGGFLIALRPKKVFKRKVWLHEGFWFAFASSFFYGLAYTFTKYVYLQTTFLNGFIWIRFGNFATALGLLLFARNRKKIFAVGKSTGKTVSYLFVGNKALASLGFIILNYAIFLGSATLVNSLQGVQYVIVFLLALLLTHQFPKFLKEEVNKNILLQKIISIGLIGAGIWLLV